MKRKAIALVMSMLVLTGCAESTTYVGDEKMVKHKEAASTSEVTEITTHLLKLSVAKAPAHGVTVVTGIVDWDGELQTMDLNEVKVEYDTTISRHHVVIEKHEKTTKETTMDKMHTSSLVIKKVVLNPDLPY